MIEADRVNDAQVGEGQLTLTMPFVDGEQK